MKNRYELMVKVGDEPYRPICGEGFRFFRPAVKRAKWYVEHGFPEDTTATKNNTVILVADNKGNRRFSTMGIEVTNHEVPDVEIETEKDLFVDMPRLGKKVRVTRTITKTEVYEGILGFDTKTPHAPYHEQFYIIPSWYDEAAAKSFPGSMIGGWMRLHPLGVNSGELGTSKDEVEEIE